MSAFQAPSGEEAPVSVHEHCGPAFPLSFVKSFCNEHIVLCNEKAFHPKVDGSALVYIHLFSRHISDSCFVASEATSPAAFVRYTERLKSCDAIGGCFLTSSYAFDTEEHLSLP